MNDNHRPFALRPLVYIAGPYAHPDPVINTREAILCGDSLNETGLVTAYVPHCHLWHIVAPHEPDYWDDYDFAVLWRSDALYRRPGASTGADKEVLVAGERKIDVYYDTLALLAWAAKVLGEGEW